MDLKEFDLDLPYIENEEKIKSIMNENGCSRNEATKLDYESSWKEKRRIFRLETRCISAMFERYFTKITTKDCWKILVECVQGETEERVMNFSGVYTLKIHLDYNCFFTYNDYQKKVKTLELIMQGIRIMTKSQEWSLEPFETVYFKICKADYINEWVWKKAVKSSDKKFNAELLMQHEVKSMDISIIIRDRNGSEITRKKVISELPDEFAYVKYLGELKWLSSNEVALINKKGDTKWLCEL